VLPPTGFVNRWVNRLSDLLKAQYPVPGVTGGGRGFIGATTSGTSSFQWPTTLAGSPAIGITLGPKSEFVQLAAATSLTVSLTGDAADIFYIKTGGGGTFSWALDGGSTTNVSTSNATTLDGQITHITMAPPGNHSLVLAGVSGLSNIGGVAEYYGDYAQGIQVHDCGHFGWKTNDWVNVLNNGTAGPANAITALNPSVVIISLGVNDQFANVLPATYQANLQSIIADLRAVMSTPYPAFVIHMYPPRTGQGGYTYPWSQYTAAAWNVATLDTGGPGSTSGVAVCDATQGPRMPGADTDTYSFWQGGDLVHPSDKGHMAIADYLCRFLTQG
jgi:hypothetical protein